MEDHLAVEKRVEQTDQQSEGDGQRDVLRQIACGQPAEYGEGDREDSKRHQRRHRIPVERRDDHDEGQRHHHLGARVEAMDDGIGPRELVEVTEILGNRIDRRHASGSGQGRRTVAARHLPAAHRRDPPPPLAARTRHLSKKPIRKASTSATEPPTIPETLLPSRLS